MTWLGLLLLGIGATDLVFSWWRRPRVAELVAAVLKVEVELGQTVAADDAVVILESMKMEIPVLADVAGSVIEIVVAAGDVVSDGDPLVV